MTTWNTRLHKKANNCSAGIVRAVLRYKQPPRSNFNRPALSWVPASERVRGGSGARSLERERSGERAKSAAQNRLHRKTCMHSK